MKKGCIGAFFALVRAGLWSQTVHGSWSSQSTKPSAWFTVHEPIWDEVYQLAEEQSVVGLLAEGLEKHNDDLNVPLELKLNIIGEALQIEQQNVEMNKFVAKLVRKMRDAEIYTLLVKGQGVAQCYEKPQWRACGDVDLFLSEDNYQKAKEVLIPLASSVETEYQYEKHLGLTIDGWTVELHGYLRSGLSSRVDRELDAIKDETFYGGNVRSWLNGYTSIFLLGAENEAFYVFTHILKHFYKEGLGLRQICDWVRLLWTYKDSLNRRLLESRIKKMGLMSEWKAFGAFAVEYLGMPVEAMPLYDVRGKKDDVRWRKKGERVLERILKSGNMGHNNDLSYRTKYSGLKYKVVALWRRFVDFMRLVPIFPMDAPRFFVSYVMRKV